MDSLLRSPRRWIYVVGALVLVAAGRLLGSGNESASTPPPPSASTGGMPLLSEAPARSPLRRPPSALVEFGVLTDRTETELRPIVERPALAALVRTADCGDERACAAVRAALEDEHTTTLRVIPASSWNLAATDLDASAGGLSSEVRASVKKRARIVVIRVATATSARHLAVRAGLAVTAALAEKIGGQVYDQLLGRIESAREFGRHAVTAPLDASSFRKDRVELLYEPKAPGVVRVLTAGLSRWGAPDVEAAAVPTASVGRVADIVLGVAEALANGATSGPVTLGRDQLAQVRGAPYAADSALPAPVPIAIELVSVHPEGGDPNDFIARIDPPDGSEPLGYLDLTERFFGSLAASPDEATLRANRERAQRNLSSALARWSSARTNGSTLLLRLPFDIAGEGGVESMWIELTGYDARSVTGRLVDDPLAATQVQRGEEVTRPRTEVEDIDTRERRDP